MRIKEIINQHRRDFTAIYECEHCQNESKGSGYDDAHFHAKVIPEMVCTECGNKSPISYEPLAPTYLESQQA